MFRRLWLLMGAVVLCGCGGPVYDETLSGPYKLWATDIDEQMHVCYAFDGGCIGRIPATVFQVGFDERYVVAASQVTSNSVGYFYIIRDIDGVSVDPSVSVHGPFDATAFAEERSRMGLPELKPIK